MRLPKFPSIPVFVQELRRRIDRDDDDILLLSGKPGRGKSTLGLKLNPLLDETFLPNLEERVFFAVPDYLKRAPLLDRGQAIQGDEMLISRRKSMTSGNIGFNDYLQRCRGLNLHQSICFPYKTRIDAEVVEERVSFVLDIETRGVFKILQPVERKWFDAHGIEHSAAILQDRGSFRFPDVDPALKARYREMKLESMRRMALEVSGADDINLPEGKKVPIRTDASLGFDRPLALAYAKRLKSKYAEIAAAKSQGKPKA